MDIRKLSLFGQTDKTLIKIGSFTFEVLKTAYDQLTRSASFRWNEQKRLFGVSSEKFVGIDSEIIELSGTIYRRYAEEKIETMYSELYEIGASGKPQVVIDSNGKNLGQWVVKDIKWTDNQIGSSGIATKSSFTISLKRYGGK